MTRHIRLTLLAFNAMLAAFTASSQDNIVQRLNAPQSAITVNAPEALLQRAEPTAQTEADATEQDTGETTAEQQEEKTVRAKGGKTVGYRVQVYADNNVRSAKSEARNRERAVSSAFPQHATYVSYASPYWRLRVGDFRSQYDAEKAAAEIRKTFPRYAREVRVVRDRINAH